jgi:hypothetical protein
LTLASLGRILAENTTHEVRGMPAMSIRRTKTAASVLCVAAILGAGAAIASATVTVRIASKVSIFRGSGLTFKGRVTSTNPGCEASRKVTLFRTNGLKLGTVTTGVHGRWKITPSGFAGISLGHYFAKVARRSEGTAGTIYVCKGATSRTIHF